MTNIDDFFKHICPLPMYSLSLFSSIDCERELLFQCLILIISSFEHPSVFLVFGVEVLQVPKNIFRTTLSYLIYHFLFKARAENTSEIFQIRSMFSFILYFLRRHATRRYRCITWKWCKKLSWRNIISLQNWKFQRNRTRWRALCTLFTRDSCKAHVSTPFCPTWIRFARE